MPPVHQRSRFNGQLNKLDDPNPKGRRKTVAEVLGEIVWILSRSPSHRHLTVADIEKQVMHKIAFGQFKLFYNNSIPYIVGFRTIVHVGQVPDFEWEFVCTNGKLPDETVSYLKSIAEGN